MLTVNNFGNIYMMKCTSPEGLETGDGDFQENGDISNNSSASPRFWIQTLENNNLGKEGQGEALTGKWKPTAILKRQNTTWRREEAVPTFSQLLAWSIQERESESTESERELGTSEGSREKCVVKLTGRCCELQGEHGILLSCQPFNKQQLVSDSNSSAHHTPGEGLSQRTFQGRVDCLNPGLRVAMGRFNLGLPAFRSHSDWWETAPYRAVVKQLWSGWKETPWAT